MTFAGSPDRAEARLVPDAGFELDTFQVSGLPRRPGPAQVRAVGKAMRAPKACKRILRAREPDVVLGGGGYVAGPMVYAASRLAIPAALMEADAHLGLANRLAAPFAERVFLAFPIEGRERPKYRVTGRPIPARNRATVACGRSPRLRPAPACARAARLRRQPGRGEPERRDRRGVRRGGPRRAAPVRASATSSGCAVASGATTTGWFRSRTNSALRSVRRTSSSRGRAAPSGRSRRRASRRSSSRTRSRPPTTRRRTRASSSAAAGRSSSRRRSSAACADLARSLIGDPERLKEMGEAMKRVAKPDAAEEIAEGLIQLARLRAVGSGSSGSAARACPVRAPRQGLGRGGRAAGIATRRRTSTTSAPPGSR